MRAQPRAETRPGQITLLLRRWSDDPTAADHLVRLIYPQLRRLAARRLAAEGLAESLQVSDLAQETLLRLLGQRTGFRNRDHFFSIAARLIRRLLVDRARARLRRRRGMGNVVAGDVLECQQPEAHPDLLALDEALCELGRVGGADALRVVELRYFLGASIEETAAVLGVGRATVVRTWRWARCWLAHRLRPPVNAAP